MSHKRNQLEEPEGKNNNNSKSVKCDHGLRRSRFVFIVGEKVIAKNVKVVPFVIMVDEEVDAKNVEVVPFVIMVDEEVDAKNVEVVTFVIMVDEEVDAKLHT